LVILVLLEVLTWPLPVSTLFFFRVGTPERPTQPSAMHWASFFEMLPLPFLAR